MALDRRDELGQLSRSFQHMTVGLAERDKVRALLGKVTSPAIAAELTRRKLLLGGEEKKVTIFFSDLRNFTPLSTRYFNAVMSGVRRHPDASARCWTSASSTCCGG